MIGNCIRHVGVRSARLTEKFLMFLKSIIYSVYEVSFYILLPRVTIHIRSFNPNEFCAIYSVHISFIPNAVINQEHVTFQSIVSDIWY